MSREDASAFLGISTRTLDRYIKNGKLSYKKFANKVLLSEIEVNSFKETLDIINDKIHQSEVIFESGRSQSLQTQIAVPSFDKEELSQMISASFEGFRSVLEQKDQQLEQKTQLILSLQSQVSDYESRFRHMVALPDHNAQKESLLIEKEKLQIEKQTLLEDVKKERIKNLIYILVIVFIILTMMTYLFFIAK